MNYLVTVGYESEKTNKHGDVTGVKIFKEKYLIEAESVEEATIVAAKYKEEDSRTSDVVSVVKSNVDVILTQKTTPEYYKG